MLTKTENRRLREPFGIWKRGEILHVKNPSAWPALELFTDPVSDSADWNGEFDAAEHARVVRLENQPPPPPARRIKYDDVLEAFAWDDEQFALAQAMHFPAAIGYEMVSSLFGGSSRQAIYSVDRVNTWIADLRRLSARLPERL